MLGLHMHTVAPGQLYPNYGVQALPKGALMVLPTGLPQTLAPTDSAVALSDLGTRLKALGDVRGAAERFFEAVSLDPFNFTAQLNLGALYLAAGDIAHALEHTEKAYALNPRSFEAVRNIGDICRSQGNLETAIQWYKAAVQLNPNCETTPVHLALCLTSRGLQLKATDQKAAIRCYREAIVHNPTNSNAYYNLGVSYAELQKHEKALINYNLAVHFDPTCAEAYNNMGVIYKERDNLEKAIKCYHMAVQCNPAFAQTLNNLGVVYTTSGRLSEAFEYLSRAATVAPTYAEAYNNLGWLFWDYGDLEQALRMYERCIELSPTSKNPSQNRLLALNYLHDVSPERVFQAHEAWAQRFCRDVGEPFAVWPNSKEPCKQLRIGYISPDFFNHSVSFFVHALLEHRNKDEFDVFLYSNSSREDEKTEVLKSLVPKDRWFRITGKPAFEVCELIRSHQIDILIELAGHTANNRLDVMALKPSPVQITYIGYNNTTGMGAIDYRIVDEIVDPLDTQQPFSEELLRIPGCFLCYTPSAKLPDVESLPASRYGFVTFGSFSCLAKVGDPCVALWARVLHEVPNSRLLVKNKGFYSSEVQAAFINKFKAHGISEQRLKLLSLTPTSFDHLNVYNEVDIALDTFPYSNTTTTCESLIMGVPPVCLVGRTHGSRVCVTLLNAIGLNQFAANNEDEYVAKAKGLATSLQSLALLRSNLRQIVLSSPLCDGSTFVREKYEPLLRSCFRRYCEGRPPSRQAFSSLEPPDPLAPGPFAPALLPGQPYISGPSSSSRARATTHEALLPFTMSAQTMTPQMLPNVALASMTHAAAVPLLPLMQSTPLLMQSETVPMSPMGSLRAPSSSPMAGVTPVWQRSAYPTLVCGMNMFRGPSPGRRHTLRGVQA